MSAKLQSLLDNPLYQEVEKELLCLRGELDEVIKNSDMKKQKRLYAIEKKSVVDMVLELPRELIKRAKEEDK